MHRRLAGRLPGVHLNQKGRDQAISLVKTLQKISIQAIYSSPLERAMETAAPLASERHLPIQIHPGLLDIDYGDWQWRTYKQVARTNLWKTLADKPSEVQFPEGESLLEAQERLVKTVNQIAANHGDRDVVACFTHADVVRLVTAHALNMPLDSFQRLQAAPAGITTIQFAGGHYRLIHFNLQPGDFLLR